MKLRAAIQYFGKRAYYEITPDKEGIYQAYLLSYEGGDMLMPPQSITLVRSVRRWAGSDEERPLIDALGAFIDCRVRGGNPHKV